MEGSDALDISLGRHPWARAGGWNTRRVLNRGSSSKRCYPNSCTGAELCDPPSDQMKDVPALRLALCRLSLVLFFPEMLDGEAVEQRLDPLFG